MVKRETKNEKDIKIITKINIEMKIRLAAECETTDKCDE